MDKDRINYFKDELRHLRYIQREIWRLNREIDGLQAEIEGVKSLTNPSGGSASPADKQRRLRALRQKQREFIKEKDGFQARADKVNGVLESLSKEDKRMLIDIYTKNRVIANVALDYYMSEDSLKRYINKIIRESEF